tara:strand:- start:1572 stop:2063 length:492 start_codon:yes stop_codon:yes gene_type:complete
MTLEESLYPNSLVTDFTLQDIPWPGGREMFKWWDQARQKRLFPTRKDFSPLAVIPLLPAIQLIDVGGIKRPYSVRLIGTRITEIIGFDPTGKELDDLPSTELVRTVYDWVVDNKKPVMRLNMPIRWGAKEFMVCSVLILPLGAGGDEVTMLMLHFHFGELDKQ